MEGASHDTGSLIKWAEQIGNFIIPIQVKVFWVVMLCSIAVGPCCLHCHRRHHHHHHHHHQEGGGSKVI
jgi:hypothetical protein